MYRTACYRMEYCTNTCTSIQEDGENDSYDMLRYKDSLSSMCILNPGQRGCFEHAVRLLFRVVVRIIIALSSFSESSSDMNSVVSYRVDRISLVAGQSCYHFYFFCAPIDIYFDVHALAHR